MLSPIKILVVDDHQIILDGLKSLFDKIDSFKVVGYATSAIQAITYLDNFEVDVLITDIEMPEQNGIWLVKKIKEEKREVKILALTMHSEKSFIEELYHLGVNGYLLKTSSQKELQLAVENIVNGKSHFSSEITEMLMRREVEEPKSSKPDLTERELETLDFLAEGMSTKEIAKKLHLSERTVEKHRASLLLKTESKNVAGLIRFGFKNGLLK